MNLFFRAWRCGLLLSAGLSLAVQAGPSRPAAVTLSATDFSPVTAAQADVGGWRLEESGAVTCTVECPSNLACTFVVVARAEKTGDEWPALEVRLDGQSVFMAKLVRTNLSTYTFSRQMGPGQHEVVVGFPNDYFANSEKRRLCFSSLTMVVPPGKTAPLALDGVTRRQRQEEDRRTLAETEAVAAIERYRKGSVRIRVVDAAGGTVAGARVSVRQLRHEFLFGTTVSPDVFQGRFSAEESRNYLERLKRYFNDAVTDDALAWNVMEPERGHVRYDAVDRLADWCRTNNIALRGHSLFCGRQDALPKWVLSIPDAEFRTAIAARAEAVVSRYKGRIAEYDVISEMLYGSYFRSRLGDDAEAQVFRGVHAVDPAAVLYVNDYDIFEGEQLKKYVQQVRALLAAGVPVGGIGIQAHLKKPVAAEKIQRVLDALAAFKLPIRVTAFECENKDEAVQAQVMEDVYRTAFAHPAVTGISMYGFWEKDHAHPAAAFLRADFTKKPAARSYEKMIFNDWWTHVDGRSEADGNFSCWAFFGEHEVLVSSPEGSEVRQVLRLSRAAREAVLELKLPAAAKAK